MWHLERRCTVLDSEQMNRLTIEATLGKPPSIPGEEAQAFYDEVLRDVTALKAKGIMPDLVQD
jgi:hypothetical protein